MLPKPPSYTEWLLDGLERGGHSVDETLQYARWVGEFEDQRLQQRHQPQFVSPASAEPRIVTRLRRWLGR